MNKSFTIASITNYSDKFDYPFKDVYLTVGRGKGDAKYGFDSLYFDRYCPEEIPTKSFSIAELNSNFNFNYNLN